MSRANDIRDEIFQLYSEIDLSQLLNKIAEKIKLFLECEEASIFIYNPVKEELYFEIATGEKGKILKEITMRKGEGIVGLIAENGQPLIINDAAQDPRVATRIDRQVQFVTRSILGIPITLSGSLLGVMEAINKKRGKFRPHDQQVIEEIARFVGIPLQNAILFKKILQETKEKEQLLLLGKKISAALNYNEIFTNLKQIIFDILNPQSIRILVQPEKKLYDLINGAVTVFDKLTDEETEIKPGHIHFPLHSGHGNLGFLEIVSNSRLPEAGVSLIRGLAAYLAIAIEKFGFYQQMVEQEKVTRELQIARDIQQSFLQPPGLQVPGLDIAYLNLSSSAVGGDYYEILPLPQRQVILSVNDVSGHGVPAALLMSIFRTNFIYQLKKDPDIGKTLTQLNDMIAETTMANIYVTSFTALADLQRMKLCYVNAGHPPAILIRGDEVRELAANSMVIGLMAGTMLPLSEIDLQPDDLVIMYTDGVIEAENGAEEPFAISRLTDYMKARRHLPAEQLKEGLIDELRRFTGAEGFGDDVTLIVAHVTPDNA